MHSLTRTLSKLPVVGEGVRFLARSRTALGYYRRPLSEIVVWLFRSREMTNFSYDLTPANKSYLAATISVITSTPHVRVTSYIDELENDEALRAHIRDATMASRGRGVADPEVKYGRRLGWYAFARALKPRLVVETGVDKGVGACVLAAALLRNEAEGCPGRYIGTDINPEAGYLFTGPYQRAGKILYGDSIASLRRLEGPIDLFINDSDHSADYEAREYATIAGLLGSDAVILGDNSHTTDKLLRFAVATGRRFVFFHEVPHRHWYPGAGIGIAWPANGAGIRNRASSPPGRERGEG